MNYYEHHLGDYAQATAHLSFVEDAAYSRLIRKYYAEEKPLPADLKAVQRLVGARTKEEKDAVETVLQEFFSLLDDGWHNSRCDEEIARYHEKQEKARRSANARWNRELQHTDGNANALRTQCEGNAHQTPDTSHQTPSSSLRSEDKRVKRSPAVKPVDVSQDVWDSYLTVRKAKRAGAVSDRIVLALREEGVKAGLTLEQTLTTCAMRGWVGFNSDWVAKDKGQQRESFYERDQRLKAENMARWAPGVSARKPVNFDFIDAEVSNVPSIESD